MRPIVFERQLAAADADGIAQAQQLLAAGDLILNGDLVVGGVAVLGPQRRLVLDSAGDLSLVNFTIYGTRKDGVQITETIAGPNAAPVTTILDFTTVTRIAASDAIGTDITVGTSEVGSSPPIPVDIYQAPDNLTLKVSLSGTIDVTVQYTNDPIFETDPIDVEWTDDTDLQNLTAGYTTATLISPVTAVRLVTNSGDGTAKFTIIQAGVMG